MSYRPIIAGSEPIITISKPTAPAMPVWLIGIDVHTTDGTEKKIWSFKENPAFKRYWVESEPETVIEGEDISGRRLCGYESIILRNCVINVDDKFGVDFTLCKSVRVENCQIVGTGDVKTGGKNYGILVQGCQNVVILGCSFAECHIGVSFTQGSGLDGHLQVQSCSEFEGQECWVMVDTHGQMASNLELYDCRCDRVIFGNQSYPLGGSNLKIHSTCEVDSVLVHGENMYSVSLDGVIGKRYFHRPYPLGIDFKGTGINQFE